MDNSDKKGRKASDILSKFDSLGEESIAGSNNYPAGKSIINRLDELGNDNGRDNDSKANGRKIMESLDRLGEDGALESNDMISVDSTDRLEVKEKSVLDRLDEIEESAGIPDSKKESKNDLLNRLDQLHEDEVTGGYAKNNGSELLDRLDQLHEDEGTGGHAKNDSSELLNRLYQLLLNRLENLDNDYITEAFDDGEDDDYTYDSVFEFETPEFILEDPENYDEKRYKKFKKYFRENSSEFISLDVDEIIMMAGFYSLKANAKLEDQLGTDGIINFLLNNLKEDKSEEVSFDFSDVGKSMSEISKTVEQLGITPDYSIDSLRMLGEYLESEGEEDKSDRARNELIIAATAYYGEVIRKNSNDAWQWYSYEEASSEGLINKERDYFNAYIMADDSRTVTHPLGTVYNVYIGYEEPDKLEFLAEFLCMKYKNRNMNIEFDDIEEITLRGSTFVLTGDFSYGSKEQVKYLIESKGGFCRSSISGKTDYLVVGKLGSPAWTYGQEGGVKVKEANEIKGNGGKVRIISEDDLISSLSTQNNFNKNSTKSQASSYTANDVDDVNSNANNMDSRHHIQSDYRLTDAEILKKYDEGYCRIIGYRQPSGGFDSITEHLGELVKIEIQPSEFIIHLDNGWSKEGPLTYEIESGYGYGLDLPIQIAFKPLSSIHHFSYVLYGTRRTLVLDGTFEENKKRFEEVKKFMKSSNSKACFVATVVYNDPMCHELDILRNWRDTSLTENMVGRAFIRLYYRYGMYLAKVVDKSSTLKKAVKKPLDCLVNHLEKRLY